MKLSKILRNGVAGTLIALLPVTAGVAATRPNAAVPMASSTAVTAQYDDDRDGVSWIALAAIGVALAVALFIILDGDDDGEGSVSPG